MFSSFFIPFSLRSAGGGHETGLARDIQTGELQVCRELLDQQKPVLADLVAPRLVVRSTASR
jgi:hypothetical protein